MTKKIPYVDWLWAVDVWLGVKAGLTMADLDDWHYADAYEGGMEPATAAKKALKAAGAFA